MRPHSSTSGSENVKPERDNHRDARLQSKTGGCMAVLAYRNASRRSNGKCSASYRNKLSVSKHRLFVVC